MVTIEFEPSAFEFFDLNPIKMAVTQGEYEVLYGYSSDSKDFKMTKNTIL